MQKLYKKILYNYYWNRVVITSHDKRVKFEPISFDSVTIHILVFIQVYVCLCANNLSFLDSISEVFLPITDFGTIINHTVRIVSTRAITRLESKTHFRPFSQWEDRKNTFKSMQAKARKGSTFRKRSIQLCTINKE